MYWHKSTAMKKVVAPAATLFWAYYNPAWADGKFEHVAVFLEQTVEDEDTEIVFDAVSGSVGLKELQIVAPDGRLVVDFKAPDSKLGIRHVTLESPEPKNDGSLQADFPAGTYKFNGTLTSSTTLRGEATLSHAFPGPARITQPRDGERLVPGKPLQIRWNPARDAAGYAVVIEQEQSGREIKVDLSKTASTFIVSDGFLLPGLEYKLAIAAIAKGGNRTVTEMDIATTGRK
jgi:hypothetical protein